MAPRVMGAAALVLLVAGLALAFKTAEWRAEGALGAVRRQHAAGDGA
jgi:hypothetical protein